VSDDLGIPGVPESGGPAADQPTLDGDAPTGERILVVEDEPSFAELTVLWLERHGWRTTVAADGAEALRAFDEERPDLVLLDLGLPGLDGWHVLEHIRATSLVPILVVTARGSDTDKVRGLGIGADDYVTKPVSFPELVARVRAALRRARAWSHPADMPELRHPGLVIDGRGHRVLADGRPIHLTPTEYRLLRELAEHPDELLSREDLLTRVWGPGYRDDVHVLQVTIRNLRAKLATAAPKRRFIATSYGLGYTFTPGAVAGVRSSGPAR
jgi:DNA-binding response OmpR family regulator